MAPACRGRLETAARRRWTRGPVPARATVSALRLGEIFRRLGGESRAAWGADLWGTVWTHFLANGADVAIHHRRRVHLRDVSRPARGDARHRHLGGRRVLVHALCGARGGGGEDRGPPPF